MKLRVSTMTSFADMVMIQIVAGRTEHQAQKRADLERYLNSQTCCKWTEREYIFKTSFVYFHNALTQPINITFVN